MNKKKLISLLLTLVLVLCQAPQICLAADEQDITIIDEVDINFSKPEAGTLYAPESLVSVSEPANYSVEYVCFYDEEATDGEYEITTPQSFEDGENCTLLVTLKADEDCDFGEALEISFHTDAYRYSYWIEDIYNSVSSSYSAAVIFIEIPVGEEEINDTLYVDVEVVPPYIGTTASTTPVVTAPDFEQYYVYSATWADANGNPIEPGFTFQGGTQYYIAASLQTEDGYFWDLSDIEPVVDNGTIIAWSVTANDYASYMDLLIGIYPQSEPAEYDYFGLWMCDAGHHPNVGGSVKITYTLPDGTIPADSGSIFSHATNQTIPKDTVVNLCAMPGDGYRFKGWYKVNINYAGGDEPYYMEDGFISSDINYSFTGCPFGDGETPYICAVFEEDDTPHPAFRKHSLVLSGQIGENFFIELPEIDGVDYTDSYMEFTVSGKDGKTTIDPIDPSHRSENGQYYGFTCFVNSIQIADTITAVFHFTKDGEECTLENTSSVEAYLDALAGTDNENLRSLVLAIADYGYHSQQYFSVLRGWEIGYDHEQMNLHSHDDFADDIEAIKSALSSYKTTKDLTSDIKKTGYSLGMQSETSIFLYVTPADGYEGSLKAKADGKTLVTRKQADGRYKVTIPDISALNLGKDYTVTLTTDSGTSTLTVSALAYVSSALNSTSDDLFANTLAATYNYYTAAKNYNS